MLSVTIIFTFLIIIIIISAYVETVIMLWLHDIVYCDIYSPVLSVLV